MRRICLRRERQTRFSDRQEIRDGAECLSKNVIIDVHVKIHAD